ncbi:MAG: outer membrane beta-barrel protein [Myxococcota bacterium]
MGDNVGSPPTPTAPSRSSSRPAPTSSSTRSASSRRATCAEVAAGGVTTVDIPLRSDDTDVYEVVVFAPEVVGGINASIDARRESTAVAEVIGAEQMARSGDSQASVALSRVTGLTIVDGRFVYVRGLGDRYSSTLLNLSTLPSPEPERRVVPLDLFPTGLLESVTVLKTWSPDLPGDFGGGVVSLNTRGVPERPFTQITATMGYVSQTTFNDGRTGFRSDTDWLGFGAGPRALPLPLDKATRNGKLVEGDLFSDGFSPEELERIGESVDASHWGLSKTSVPPDASLQVGIGRKIDLGGPRIGVFGGATWQNTWNLTEQTQRFFDLGGGGKLELQNAYDFQDLDNDILLGGIANLAIELNDDQGVYYTGVLSRSSSYQSRQYQGVNGDLGSEIRVNRLTWVERQLAFHQLRGRHVFAPLADFTVEWRYAQSSANREQPDQREFRYDLEEQTGEFLISDRPEGNNILYSTLQDHNRDGRLDLTLPLGSDDRPGRISIGGQVVAREREVETRRFSYFERGTLGDDLRPLPPEELFSKENIGVDGYELREVTRSTDSYTADQKLLAGYMLADFPFDAVAHSVRGLRELNVMAGARVEQSRQTVTTYELFNPDLTPVVADLETLDVLPSVVATQGLTPPPEGPDDGSMQIRAGWSRTVSRPDFRELSQAPFNDVTGGREIFGNPELQRAVIDHFDLRWEWYPRQGEFVSLGVFHKRFTDPIETVIIPSAQLSVTWQNAQSADNSGLEVDLRKTLFGLGVPLLDHMYVGANGAIIRSRVDLGDGGGVQTDTIRALQGQSPWVANLQLGYDNPETKSLGTVSFNVAGPRIIEVGALGAPNTIEEPVPRLDVLLQQGFAHDFALRLRGRNLFDPNVKITQGDQTVREGRLGWQALLSVEWKP